MKQKIVYCCDVCGQQFDDKEQAVRHEALHYNLTPSGYADWKELCHKAALAGQRVSISKNPETESVFDRAIKEVCAFERQYGLDSMKRPSDFY